MLMKTGRENSSDCSGEISQPNSDEKKEEWLMLSSGVKEAQ